jgi:hypothetical protein
MKHCCEHCGGLIAGSAYRVTSKEDDITLLDLVVCLRCSIEAIRLRLNVKEISISSKTRLATSRGTHHSRLGL